MRTAVLVASLLVVAGPQTSFLSPAQSPVHVGHGSGTILFGDVNGDGRADLMTRHLLTRFITVLLGDGRGAFTAAPGPRVTLPYEPGDFAQGDLNEDGRLDLVITPGDRDIVDVLLGDGAGGFARTARSPFTVTSERYPFNKRTLRLVDINEDGHLDAITANGRRRNTAEVMFGNGRGELSRGPSVPLDSGCDGIVYALGNLDDDDHLDVVSACRPIEAPDRHARLVVQSGDGTGRFRRSLHSPLDVPAGARSVVVADLDGDARSEIAVLHVSGAVTVLRNGRDGRLATAPGPPLNVGDNPYSLRVADVNTDGKPDLLAAVVDRVVILVGGPSGFAPAAGSPFKAGPGAYFVTVADVNGDGLPDVAASSFEGEAITLLFGRR